VRSRAELFAQRKTEITKLSLNAQRAEKEIARLKEMLRLMEKRDVGVQTESEEAEERRHRADKGSSSWRKRMETSTGESELTSETGAGRVSQLSRRPTLNRDGERESERPNSANKKQSSAVDRVRLGDARKAAAKERIPQLKKYKFVPTLPFKHI
jgi:hypothetical protein